LWDRNAVTNPASFSIQTLTIGNETEAFGVLHIADGSAPSPVGTQLSALVGQSATGTWQLDVYGTGTAPAFMDWSLHFTGHGPTCGPSTCATGCCQGGTCVAGTGSTACGTGGAICQSCGAGTSCVNHACQLLSPGQTCGANVCGAGTYCCNASCGTCAPVG